MKFQSEPLLVGMLAPNALAYFCHRKISKQQPKTWADNTSGPKSQIGGSRILHVFPPGEIQTGAKLSRLNWPAPS